MPSARQRQRAKEAKEAARAAAAEAHPSVRADTWLPAERQQELQTAVDRRKATIAMRQTAGITQDIDDDPQSTTRPQKTTSGRVHPGPSNNHSGGIEAPGGTSTTKSFDGGKAQSTRGQVQHQSKVSGDIDKSTWELWNRINRNIQAPFENDCWIQAVQKALGEMVTQLRADIDDPKFEVYLYYHNADAVCKTLIVSEIARRANGIYDYRCQKARYRYTRKEKRRAKVAWDAT